MANHSLAKANASYKVQVCVRCRGAHQIYNVGSDSGTGDGVGLSWGDIVKTIPSPS